MAEICDAAIRIRSCHEEFFKVSGLRLAAASHPRLWRKKDINVVDHAYILTYLS